MCIVFCNFILILLKFSFSAAILNKHLDLDVIAAFMVRACNMIYPTLLYIRDYQYFFYMLVSVYGDPRLPWGSPGPPGVSFLPYPLSARYYCISKEAAVYISSNSTYSICCGFVVQHFDLLWICCGFASLVGQDNN